MGKSRSAVILGPSRVHVPWSSFGTRLIERGLAQDLGGDVRLTYPRAGVVCIMNVPLGAAGGAAGADPSW